MNNKGRARLQVDLSAVQRRFLHSLGEKLGGAGEAETARRVLDLVAGLTGNIEQGFKVVVVPTEDERPDALPELTQAVRPGSQYMYLVSRPHAWRKQLVFKGHRLTVGQFLHAMRVNKMGPQEAAADLDLPVEAAYEAIEYGERFAALIAAEAAEDARAARMHMHATATG